MQKKNNIETQERNTDRTGWNKFGYFVSDLHKLLRPELLQYRVAHQRHQRDLFPSTTRQVEIEAQTAR